MRPVNAPQTTATGTYSMAYEVSGASRLVFVSGQVAQSPDGGVPDGFEPQARLVFANLEAQLGACDMAFANVVKLTSFLTRREDVPAFRAIREELFADHRPASTLVLAELIDPDWLLEVEAVAVA
ncbi:RidA family protein [Acuticoccus sp.]|uniref:RidA family protein n=1 Tax=Acuticoccus sp. TaxID=1904378 RepID=UPI003B529166